MASTEVQARQRNWFTGQAKKCVLCVSSCSKVICGWLKYKIAVMASGQELGLLDYRGERKCKASNALRNFTSAPLEPPARERERERWWEEWHEAQKGRSKLERVLFPAQPNPNQPGCEIQERLKWSWAWSSLMLTSASWLRWVALKVTSPSTPPKAKSGFREFFFLIFATCSWCQMGWR